jgi:dTDP-4-dehydrorhamnose 3,5-epimerase
MFEIEESGLPGCRALTPAIHRDRRGHFIKTFHRDWFAAQGMATDFAEAYYSVSRRGVLRGLHFQLPPHQHAKLVYCVEGAILDAVVDLRRGSARYGAHALFSLSGQDGRLVYVPPGLAHGFYVTSESATVIYNVTSTHHPAADAGILWSSAGIPWPDPAPVLSERDSGFPPLSEFSSPFQDL